nr:EOG090X0864 [Moina brachiata]
MGVETVGDLCKIPVARFGSPHRLDVDTIKKAVDRLFAKKAADKSRTASVPQKSQSKNDDATVPLMTEDIQVETPTPIKSSEDSESSDGIKSQDSCPNGQIIKGDSFEVPLTQSDEANKSSTDVSPVVSDDSGNRAVITDNSVPDTPSHTKETPLDIMALGSEEMISLIERHPKKDEIILSLLRRHISFSFMLNGKGYVEVLVHTSKPHYSNCSGTSVSGLNRVVNQLYESSTTSASSSTFDTRVLLTDFRDALLRTAKPHEELNTFFPIDVLNVDRSEESNTTSSAITFKPSCESIPNLADENKTYQHVVMGGTFDRLHAGHKILLSAAVLRTEKSLTIGVTDGEMIHTKKLWELIEPCETRIQKLREFLVDIEPRLEYRIVPIRDPYGPTAYDPDLQLIVVSEETLVGGLKVNELRKQKGLSILDVHPISLIDDTYAAANEENKISSSSFRKRLLGTHLKPSKVIFLLQGYSEPYVIGLTGGIASGKTSICKRLENMGAKVISCDQLGHAAYKKGTKCYQQVLDFFGDSILNDEGEIDRKKLGPIVFSNKENLAKLNSMVWPEIRRMYLDQINGIRKENFKGIVVLDAAILLEAGWDQDCAEVWVSIVPKEEAIKRITNRDSIPAEQATKRVESQLSNYERVSRANVVFCSVWEPEVTAAQVRKAWESVREYLKQHQELHAKP